VLDEVHERDIDTDFILLTLKRLARRHPKLRVLLMSATIDNDLFRYYFADDHVDSLPTRQNFYHRLILAQQAMKRPGDEERSEDSADEQELHRIHGLEFMKSLQPCPAINVTEPGKFRRDYFYLDTLQEFMPTLDLRWGSVVFSEKYPSTHKELYGTVCLIIDHISVLHSRDAVKPSVLVFMPGLGEIESLADTLTSFLRTERV
jgi:HrpA-like RNA helicase